MGQFIASRADFFQAAVLWATIQRIHLYSMPCRPLKLDIKLNVMFRKGWRNGSLSHRSPCSAYGRRRRTIIARRWKVITLGILHWELCNVFCCVHAGLVHSNCSHSPSDPQVVWIECNYYGGCNDSWQGSPSSFSNLKQTHRMRVVCQRENIFMFHQRFPKGCGNWYSENRNGWFSGNFMQMLWPILLMRERVGGED